MNLNMRDLAVEQKVLSFEASSTKYVLVTDNCEL
jgi:hypothetical protein